MISTFLFPENIHIQVAQNVQISHDIFLEFFSTFRRRVFLFVRLASEGEHASSAKRNAITWWGIPNALTRKKAQEHSLQERKIQRYGNQIYV